MTQAELFAALKSTGLPVTYNHWGDDDVPTLPYLAYRRSDSDDLMADNHNFKAVTGFDVELYTEKINLATEAKIENMFKEHRIPYDKTELWIDSEELYMILYEITI